MATTSFFYTMDTAMRSLLFTKFGATLGINTLNSGTADNINQGVVQTPKDIALRELAEKRGGSFLEFINFYRTPGTFDWERNRTRAARGGLIVEGATENDVSLIRGVPVKLNYDVWFWSNSYDKLGLVALEYLFWQHENPKLAMTLNSTYSLDFDLHFDPIIDESPIDLKYEIGQFFVFKMGITLDSWLFRVTDLSGGTISKITLRSHDTLNVTNENTLILEHVDYDAQLAAAVRMFHARLYGIFAVSVVDSTITVLGNFAADFTVGVQFYIENSTGNNRLYTAVSSVVTGGNTVITVIETVADGTADGNIYIPE